MTQTFHVNELSDWDACVDALLPRLAPGSVLALSGPLGAGKTALVQRLAVRLGSDAAAKSPTFALLRTYPLAAPPLRRLLHVDAYRLESEADAAILNLDEELEEPGTIAAIEWPERIEGWLAGRGVGVLRLTIVQAADGRRTVELQID